MIIAHGIDLVEIASNRTLLNEPTGQWLQRCFTAQEQADTAAKGDRLDRLSSRFAIKEAVMKALGTGFSGGIGFIDIEVVTLPSGVPTIALHRRAQERATELGITRWLVSTSHDGGLAIASVIALSD